MNLLQLLAMHLVGAAGGLFLSRFKVPAGTLIGALLAVMVYNAAFGGQTYPTDLRVVVQILSGLVIGRRFTQADIKCLKSMILPVILMVILLLLINLMFAFIMEHFTTLGFMTSFFACAPGGVSDLALVATDFGAVMEHVALLQLFRLVSVVIIFPPLIRKILHISTPQQAMQQMKTKRDYVQLDKMPFHLLTLVCAMAGGGLFHFLNIPAGAILGSIFAVALLNLVSDHASFPPFLRIGVQICAGTYIGSKITFQTLLTGKILLVPALILMIELFFMAFVTAFVLHKVTKLNWATALFSATPGGIQEMGLISDDLGLETPKIVLMHTFRILAVLGVLPLIAGFLG